MHMALALEKPEHRDLARCTTSSPALSVAAEITLIDLDLTAENLLGFHRQFGENHLAQLVVKQDRRIAIYPC